MPTTLLLPLLTSCVLIGRTGQVSHLLSRVAGVRGFAVVWVAVVGGVPLVGAQRRTSEIRKQISVRRGVGAVAVNRNRLGIDGATARRH